MICLKKERYALIGEVKYFMLLCLEVLLDKEGVIIDLR
jgi:hypothetical protein